MAPPPPPSKDTSGLLPEPEPDPPVPTAPKLKPKKAFDFKIRKVRHLGLLGGSKRLARDPLGPFPKDEGPRPSRRETPDNIFGGFGSFGGFGRFGRFAQLQKQYLRGRRTPSTPITVLKDPRLENKSDEQCSKCHANLDVEKGIWFLNKCLGALCNDCVNQGIGAINECEIHPIRKQQTVCKLQFRGCIRCRNATLPFRDLMLTICGHPICEPCLHKVSYGSYYPCTACHPDSPDPEPMSKAIVSGRYIRHARPECSY